MAGTEASLHQTQEGDEDTSDQLKPEPSIEQALESWNDSAWSRLNAIPESTDKYKSTCNAVHQVQQLIQEVLEKRELSQAQIDDSLELSFKFDSLVKLMSSKQEQLFQGVVHFHTSELARIGVKLDEAERKLAESPLIKGYVEQQKHLHKLKGAREELLSYQTDLQQLVDAPSPLTVVPDQQQQQLVQQEQVPSPLLSPSENTPSSPTSSTSPVFSELKTVQGKAQLISLRCQQLCQNFDDRLENLEKELKIQSDRFMKELVDVEIWIQNAHSLLREEPARAIEGIYSQDEMDAEEAEVMGQRSRDGSSMGMVGGHQLGYVAGTPDLFSSGEFIPSDGSLGSDGFIIGSLEEGKVHDTSVDPDLSDEEYNRQMLERVISPEPVEGGSSVDQSDGEEADREDEGGSDVDKTYMYSVQFAMSPEPEEGEEQGVEPTTVEGESVVSESTLRGGDQDTSVDREEEEGASTVASTEQSEAVTQETRSTSTSSKYSINWVKGLGFVKMYHDPELDLEMPPPGRYQSQHREIDIILGDLEDITGQMSVQSQKMKRAMANTSFVMSSASTEQAAQLQGRQSWVKGRWAELAEQLKRRKIQLTFEKAEKAVLESITETCQELKEQPDGVLLKEEMESKRRDLMDFIVDMEQYSLQMSQQLKELDDSFGELKGVCPDEAELLEKGEETVKKLRKAYEDVAGKVKEQQTFLDKSLSLWGKFHSQCEVFEDWLSWAEELVTRDSYGYTLKETEGYCTSIKQLKEKISLQECQFTSLVEHGRALLDSMDPQTEAEQYMDGKLSSLDQRWTELVSQDRGSIDTRLADVDKVLISWRGYTKMRGGTQSFVSQMTKMVGTEPLESSHGDQSLLPTYMTYASQLKSVEVQYGRVMAFGEELVGNSHVGGGVAIKQEIEELRMKFEPLKDNVVDSLELLKREYNEWIMVKLHQMSQLVSQANDMTERELKFIKAYPLDRLMETPATGLLEEAKLIMDNLDQVNQMEADCTVIEERLLERQIEHETSSDEALEFPATLAEKQRLQEERERLLGLSDTLEPMLRVCYQQLRILGKIQEGSKVVVMVNECVGQKDELGTLLVDAKLKLSEDEFEGLRGEVYDLGTISEEGLLTGSEKQISITLPPYDKVVEVNRSLTEAVETLSNHSNETLGHLQLIIEWWSEFNSNHGDMSSWLSGMEERAAGLEAQLESTVSPRPCPLSLQQLAKDICDEVEGKSVVVRALSSTGKSLIINMKTAERSPDLNKHINDVISETTMRWEELKRKTELHSETAKERGEKFETFINHLTDFMSWLSEFYSTVYEEFLERIPPKASDEIIAHHRTTLRRFFSEAHNHRAEHDSLEAESEEWAEHLIPEEFQEDLLSPSEPSPPPFADDEFPPPSLLPYVKRRTTSILDKWSKLHRFLKEREQQLEMSSGSMHEYIENLQNLLNWIDGELKRDSLAATPPAHAPQLKGYLEQLRLTGSEFSEKQSTRDAVERLATSLKSQVAPELATTIDGRMEELMEKWKTLEGKLTQRRTVLPPLLSSVEAHSNSCSEFESWLEKQERTLEECGPIGADLNRLEEQNELLKQLDEGLLERKRTCGDLQNDAQTVATDCSPESLAQLTEKVKALESQYSDINQSSLERQERCEEALAAMQSFQKKVDSFVSWLEAEEKKLEVHVKTKKPIGIIQSELESFYDFMSEVEQHSNSYNDLIPESQELSAEYKPSTALDNMMEELRQRWFKHVEEGLLERCDKLLGLLDYWQRYEKEVKDLLSWIMDEANKFSKEVTTRGDKGIEDHIESCKIFTETLQNKKTAVEGIEDLADLLRTEDGEKKNGTSDVESRWKDVNQHWNSLCKLLQETLLRLEATYAEVRQVLQIRREEFDWLDDCEHVGYMKRPIRGNLDTVQEEIESHEESLIEVEAHESESEFVMNTVPFLVEHSRKAVREEIKLRAEEHSQRYNQLREFLGGYVGDLKDSIPFWKEFNLQTEDLGQWLRQTNEELESDRTQPGNATVTENSLRNTHELQVDIGEHDESIEEATRMGNALKRLVGDDDQQYITEVLQRLKFSTQEVEQEAEERVEQLEERYKSWKVFPVEEARVVQEFLSAVEGEMEEEITEEMTADQLLEKLERLELLQQTQSQKEGEVKAIDQSADSEEVKKALQKNPDISKERNNLLQGWSSVSSVLKSKIATMRKRATMMKSVEDALKQCERGLKEFKVHLDTPLPSLLLLANQQKELNSKTTQLHNQCRASLNDMRGVFGEYAGPGNADLAIPAHLQERGNEMEEEFNHLVAMAKEQTDQIEESASSWGEFSKGLEDFERWLRTSSSELSSLKAVEKFAAQFSDLEDRLQMLTDDMTDRVEQFDRLKILNARLTTGDSPDIVEIRERFERCEKMWGSLKSGVDTLPAAMEPWKKVTNQHDELEYWFDELEKRASRDLDALGAVQDDTTDVCDHIYKLKIHMEKLSQQAPELQELQENASGLLTDNLCDKHEPVRTLRKQCEQLEPRWEKLQKKIDNSLQQLENRHTQWRSDAIESIRKYMDVRLQLDELRDEKDNEIRELKYRLDHRSRPAAAAERQNRTCCPWCDGWKIAAFILFVMVILLVLVLVGVIAFQIIDPDIRPI